MANPLKYLLCLGLFISLSFIEINADRCVLYVPPFRSLTDGQWRICILDIDVNRAYERAKASRQAPQGDPSDPSFIGATGEIIQTTVEELLRELVGLSSSVASIFHQIDTTKTKVDEICPDDYRVGAVKCGSSRFRRIDGYCSQPQGDPASGAANQILRRELPAAYADGVSRPRISVTGGSLPLARVVSNTVHPPLTALSEPNLNVMFLSFGHFIDHEIVSTGVFASPSGALPNPGYNIQPSSNFECCVRTDHPTCLPLRLPPNDPFYARFGLSCFNFQRVLPGVIQGCPLWGVRNQFNGVTPVLDASAVYGSSMAKSDALRDPASRGRLATFSPWKPGQNFKPLLPQKTTDPSVDCLSSDLNNQMCFVAGDDRSTVQPVLTAVHVIFLRAHNDIADKLSDMNPDWSEDRVFLETQRIIGAIQQQIVVNEWLPALLSPVTIQNYELKPSQLFKATLRPAVNAQASQGFSTAGFRFGHSLLPDSLLLSSPSHADIGFLPLRSVLLNPEEFYKPGRVDNIILGSVNQPSGKFDRAITDEVRNHLFEPRGQPFGMDLAARNIERGREHGVPAYAVYRPRCGLSLIRTWEDMDLVMANGTVAMLRSIYSQPVDVDLWTGGLAEKPMPGSILGPTFSCIIGEQFNRIIFGDNFWYENQGQPSSFTDAQLREIKKITWARLLCDHGDQLQTIQRKTFLLPNPSTNPRVSCMQNIIPRLNLDPWRE